VSLLSEILLAESLAEKTIREEIKRIEDAVLSHSSFIKTCDFRAIHPRDLEFLFDAYESSFFRGALRQALGLSELRFTFSPRMTLAGGKTKRFQNSTGQVSFEISIASSMLFDAFGETDRDVTVCGIPCDSRLEALLRIFEHELVHLAEFLCWSDSNCSKPRFQGIANRYFQHQAHTHSLLTRRERAAESGIRVGSKVAFVFEGERFTGHVNRITKRATVLVEHVEGRMYSDGRKYKVFYIPLAELTLLLSATN
jgi:hypothetical protein